MRLAVLCRIDPEKLPPARELAARLPPEVDLRIVPPTRIDRALAESELLPDVPDTRWHAVVHSIERDVLDGWEDAAAEPSSVREVEEGLCRMTERLGTVPLVLMNMFRFVPGERSSRPHRERSVLLDRIRAFNAMLIRVSHASGAYVLDIDRILSIRGGRELETDYRLDGAPARELLTTELVRMLKLQQLYEMD